MGGFALACNPEFHNKPQMLLKRDGKLDQLLSIQSRAMIAKLPSHVLANVFSYLGQGDMQKIGFVNRCFYSTVRAHWKKLARPHSIVIFIRKSELGFRELTVGVLDAKYQNATTLSFRENTIVLHSVHAKFTNVLNAFNSTMMQAVNMKILPGKPMKMLANNVAICDESEGDFISSMEALAYYFNFKSVVIDFNAFPEEERWNLFEIIKRSGNKITLLELKGFLKAEEVLEVHRYLEPSIICIRYNTDDRQNEKIADQLLPYCFDYTFDLSNRFVVNIESVIAYIEKYMKSTTISSRHAITVRGRHDFGHLWGKYIVSQCPTTRGNDYWLLRKSDSSILKISEDTIYSFIDIEEDTTALVLEGKSGH